MMIKNVNHQLLHLQVRRLLLKSIIQGEFAAAHMLPTEAELCTHLGVSRSTLRHAVTSLEQEGYLHRRQGLGTIIDRNVCSVTARFDLNSEFSILLNDLGYKPSVRFIDAREETASAGVAGLLKTQEGAALLSITKLWLADDRPAIWCTDSIPTALIIKSYRDDLLRADVFSFLKQACSQVVNYQIANLFARRLGDELGQLMGIDADEPVVACTACGYNPDGMPVLYNLEVYAPGIMTPTVLRAKI
jgi:GntR family transcriptional regulator